MNSGQISIRGYSAVFALVVTLFLVLFGNYWNWENFWKFDWDLAAAIATMAAVLAAIYIARSESTERSGERDEATKVFAILIRGELGDAVVRCAGFRRMVFGLRGLMPRDIVENWERLVRTANMLELTVCERLVPDMLKLRSADVKDVGDGMAAIDNIKSLLRGWGEERPSLQSATEIVSGLAILATNTQLTLNRAYETIWRASGATNERPNQVESQVNPIEEMHFRAFAAEHGLDVSSFFAVRFAPQ